MDSVHLQGSEDVLRAGQSMRSAAEEMSRAAASIEGTQFRLQQSAEEYLGRFEDVLRAADPAPPVIDIPKGAPWPKSMTSEPITCSIIAPCGCSMPVQVVLSASTGQIPSLPLDAQAAAATCEPIGGMAVEYKEVGSPIPCATHRQKEGWPVLRCEDCEGAGHLGESEQSGKKIACETCGGNEDRLGRGWIQIVEEPPATLAPGSVYMSRAALEAAWDVVRVADHHEGELHPPAYTVSVNLAVLRALRAALPKE